MTEGRLQAEVRLSDVRAAGGSMRDLIAEAGQVVGGVVYLLDPDERIMASSTPPGCDSASIPRLTRLLESIGSRGEPPISAVVVPSEVSAGRRLVLAPVAYQGDLFGYVVLGAAPGLTTTESGFDGDAEPDQHTLLWIADRLTVHLRGEFLAQRRLARVAWNARANLGRQMVRSSSYDADLRACAEYLGVDLDADRVVLFVLERGRPSGSTIDAVRLADLMSVELGVEILPIRGSEGVLLAVLVESRCDPQTRLAEIKGAVLRGLDRMGDEHAVVGLSSITRAGLLRRAYREAREVARCVDRYAVAGTRAVGSDELGPARLFVANSDEHAVRLYVHDVLGPLLDGGEAAQVLLATLQAFFTAGRSVRESASALRVHENTVRHRLSRVHELTGLDVASTSNDQLSIQTALLVLTLQGHPTLTGFGRGAARPRALA